jgi:predicted nucleotidyltransferase
LEEVLAEIQSSLTAIEAEEQCAILLAVESGSRAWGFASTDSDYDVRFIYVRPVEWYLSIDVEHKRDVVERPISGYLDVSGWDLRKALRLLRKSNPPLLEWLQSPIVYREHPVLGKRLRALIPDSYSPLATHYHYLHMAQGNFRGYLQGEIVWRKKYLYVLRPLLALRWIEAGLGPVPIEFEKVLNATVPSGAVRQAIDYLLAAKRAGAELDHGPRINEISDFVERELARAEAAPAVRQGDGDSAALDNFFQAALATVWS